MLEFIIFDRGFLEEGRQNPMLLKLVLWDIGVLEEPNLCPLPELSSLLPSTCPNSNI